MAKKAIKKTEKPASKKAEEKKEPKISGRYFEAKGGRKTAIARVRISAKFKGIVVNGKDYKEYFHDLKRQKEVADPIELMGVGDKIGVMAKVSGGGLTGQAEAIRHGISRALVIFNEEFRKPLRKYGFLTRDARMVERKKYGLKKARRAPQWAKR